MLISIETHMTFDFPGGERTPYPPPLDPHMTILGKEASDYWRKMMTGPHVNIFRKLMLVNVKKL